MTDCLNVTNRFQLPRLETSQEKPAPHFPFAVGRRLGGFHFSKPGSERGCKVPVLFFPVKDGGVHLPYHSALARELILIDGIINSHLFSYQSPGQEGERSSSLPHFRTGAGGTLRFCDKTRAGS